MLKQVRNIAIYLQSLIADFVLVLALFLLTTISVKMTFQKQSFKKLKS